MSLDKFGRYLVGADDGVNIDGRQGPPGEGFKLTPDKQNYDLQKKRLVNLGDPVHETDAVNYKSLKRNCLVLDVDKLYNAENKRLINLADPTNEADAVNFKSLKRNCLTLSEEGNQYNVGNNYLVNLTDPTGDGDAVNYKSLKRMCLTTSPDGVGDYNASGRRVCSLGNPRDDNDAVTLKYVNENYVKTNNALLYDGKKYNARGGVITNVRAPLSGTDAVPLSFMVENTLMKNVEKDTYNAFNKNITHLKWPTANTDAVNKQYVDTMCPLMDINGGGGWQFLFQRVKGVANPVESHDAVNYDTLLDIVYKLVIFILQQSIGPITLPPNIANWTRNDVIQFLFKNISK
jgi:hypothetical protein